MRNLALSERNNSRLLRYLSKVRRDFPAEAYLGRPYRVRGKVQLFFRGRRAASSIIAFVRQHDAVRIRISLSRTEKVRSDTRPEFSHCLRRRHNAWPFYLGRASKRPGGVLGGFDGQPSAQASIFVFSFSLPRYPPNTGSPVRDDPRHACTGCPYVLSLLCLDRTTTCLLAMRNSRRPRSRQPTVAVLELSGLYSFHRGAAAIAWARVLFTFGSEEPCSVRPARSVLEQCGPIHGITAIRQAGY